MMKLAKVEVAVSFFTSSNLFSRDYWKTSTSCA